VNVDDLHIGPFAIDASYRAWVVAQSRLFTKQPQSARDEIVEIRRHDKIGEPVRREQMSQAQARQGKRLLFDQRPQIQLALASAGVGKAKPVRVEVKRRSILERLGSLIFCRDALAVFNDRRGKGHRRRRKARADNEEEWRAVRLVAELFAGLADFADGRLKINEERNRHCRDYSTKTPFQKATRFLMLAAASFGSG